MRKLLTALGSTGAALVILGLFAALQLLAAADEKGLARPSGPRLGHDDAGYVRGFEKHPPAT
jgi:hypothetical protein